MRSGFFVCLFVCALPSNPLSCFFLRFVKWKPVEAITVVEEEVELLGTADDWDASEDEKVSDFIPAFCGRVT